MSLSEISLKEAVRFVVDNRGKSAPTEPAGIKLIATKCISNQNLYPTNETLRYVSEETYRNWFRAHPEPGDIILTNKGSQNGAVCLVPDPVDFCIAQDMVALRANEAVVDPLYLFAALRSSIVQQRMRNLNVDAVIPHFKKTDFDKLFFPLWDRGTQTSIGRLHFDLVYKIELNRRMNETLEAMARALFKDWFVDFAPTRAKAEGRAPYLAPEIWDLFPDALDDEDKPVGWALGTLADVAESPRRGISPADVTEDTPYIGLEHMPRRSIALSGWEGAGKVTSNKSIFKKGEFLFGKLRPYFHKVGFAPLDGICSTDIVVVVPRAPEWGAFTISCLSSDEFVNYTDQTSTGTKMPRTTWKTMGQYKACLPSEQVVRCFQRMAQPLLDRVSTSIHEARTLAQTRDLLLPKLMSGEIRLRDAEKAVEAVA